MYLSLKQHSEWQEKPGLGICQLNDVLRRYTVSTTIYAYIRRGQPQSAVYMSSLLRLGVYISQQLEHVLLFACGE